MLASLNTVGLCYTATHGRIFKTFERVFGLDNKGPIKSNERLKRRDRRLDTFIETTAWLNICKADFTISPTV